MRIFTTIIQLGLIALLFSCDRQHSVPDVDPMLGRGCFENHRASLPPGTQYEGIVKLADSRLTVKIMNGVDVTTIECALNPDGTLQGSGK
jgi:hypothetical protein